MTNTTTPEQAYALCVSGGIQPWSITPEGALALVQENRKYSRTFDAYGGTPTVPVATTTADCTPTYTLPVTRGEVLQGDAQRFADWLAGFKDSAAKAFRIVAPNAATTGAENSLIGAQGKGNLVDDSRGGTIVPRAAARALAWALVKRPLVCPVL